MLVQHDVLALSETRTNDLSRLAPYMRKHVVVCKTDGQAGKPGTGLAVLARPHVADHMSVFHVTDFSVWLHVNKHLWGLDDDVMLGVVYIPPQSTHFHPSRVSEHYMTLFDEVLAASQVTPNIFLMGDFNAKLGTLGEVADDQLHLLHAFPCLQNRRMSEFSDVNCAGTFLADLAMAAGLLFCTGRTPGDRINVPLAADLTISFSLRRCLVPSNIALSIQWSPLLTMLLFLLTSKLHEKCFPTLTGTLPDMFANRGDVGSV